MTYEESFKNWDRYKKEQKFLQYRDANGHLRGEPGLEIVSPEFDLITAVTGLKPGLKTIEKSIQATADRGGFTVSTPYLGDKIGKITAWIPTDRSPLKGISYIATGRGGDAGVPINYIKSAVSGEGRKLYDAAIKDALNRGYKGIITGKELISAPKTYSTLEHYWPNRTKLGDFGTWSNKGMVPNQEQRQNTVFDLQDFLKAVSENPNQKTTFIGAPVYRLEQPSRKYKNGKLPGFYKGTGPANQESSSTTIYNAVRSMPWQGYWNKAKQIAKDAVSFWPGIGGAITSAPEIDFMSEEGVASYGDVIGTLSREYGKSITNPNHVFNKLDRHLPAAPNVPLPAPVDRQLNRVTPKQVSAGFRGIGTLLSLPDMYFDARRLWWDLNTPAEKYE